MLAYSNSIARQFIIRILLFSMVITTILTAIQLYMDYEQGLAEIENRKQLIQLSYLDSLTNSIWVLDNDAMSLQLDGIFNIPDVQYIEIKDQEEIVISQGEQTAVNTIEYQFPLNYQYREENIPLGKMLIQFTLTGLYQQLLEKTVVIAITQGIKTLLVSFFIFFIFHLLVGRYLSQISTFADQLKPQHLDRQLTLKPKRNGLSGRDEISLLESSLNKMREYFLQYQQDKEEKEQALTLFKNQIGHSRDSLYMIEPKTAVIRDVNLTACQFLGYRYDELVGKTMIEISSDIAHEKDWKAIADNIISSHDGMLIENRHIHKSGELMPVEVSIKVVDYAGNPVFVAFARDVSERMQAQEKLVFQAQHDQLTQLPNRLLLQDRIQQLIAEADRNKDKVALLFIDLDHFKHINDSYGHAFGDKVLLRVAKRLQNVLRKNDTLARLGGDEFVALTHIADMLDDAVLLANKLIEALLKPMQIDNVSLLINISIGISVYPDDAKDTELLMRNADAAMYKAKSMGRNNFQYYSPELSEQAEHRLRLELDINQALINKEFMVHYQPQFRSPNGEIIGAEALVRWKHPDRGIISPAEFIPLAEQTGQIRQIDQWVLSHVCQFITAQQNRGLKIPKISVNFSSTELQSQSMYRKFCETLERFHCDPQYLEIEITESQLMTNADQCIEELHKLRSLGIEIAIDDFGTGYSSLSYLKKLPITRLKIDQSFVRDIEEDESDKAIIEAIIAMGKSLNIQTIAEGVETKIQHDFLLANECHEVQGFLFSKPLTETDFLKFLSCHQVEDKTAKRA